MSLGGIIPKSKIADAIHLAVATVNGIDYLVSWNVRHLTRPVKRKQIAEFNSKLGIYVPVISTPDDFLETL
ncbi:MAG: hypothetical protein FJ044_01160 [Candidatus Cloacimonetes bacterium]|nr:hypothetical protein [Candidatus Cloacimonadota bacterium]